MKLILLKTYGASPQETVAIKNAFNLVNFVTLSPIFQDLFLSKHCTETNGMDQVELVNFINSATVETNVAMYYRWWSKVVGYTQLKGTTINVNRKFFRGPIGIASNFGHEALHELGFTHDKVWSTSVPYTFNSVFEEACGRLDLTSYL